MPRIDWSQTEIRLSRCARVRCEPGWRLGPEWSKGLRDFDLWFVWGGRGRMRTCGGEVTLRPGTCLWMRPGGRYEATQDESDRLGVNYIHFTLADLSAGLPVEPDSLPPEVREVEDVAYFDTVTTRIIELERRARFVRDRPSGEEEGVSGLLMRALLRELEEGSSDPGTGETPGLAKYHREVVFRQVSRIYESPADSPPVRELAREAGYSPDHFARVFKEVTGQTPSALRIQARIERARQLLSESSLPIGAIAAVLGYEDVFFFSKQFREKTGYTPTGFRRRGGGEAPGP